MPTYRVYVLRNFSGLRYIGLSEDVERRLTQHNAGASQWTSARGSWQLIWQSEPMGLSAARKLENTLKRQKGGVGFYRLTGLAPGS